MSWPALSRPGSVRPVHLLMLLAMSAVWGSSFLAIKVAVGGVPPLTVAAGRIAVAAAALLFWVRLSGLSLPRGKRNWRLIAVIGLLNTVLPFFLISWAEQHIPSGVAAILMATGPLTALILSHAMTHDDRFTVPKAMGVVVGFAGVVLLVGMDALAGIGADVIGQLAVIGASFCYSISGVLTRRVEAEQMETVAAGVLLSGACMGVPAAALIEQPWQASGITPLMVVAVVYLGLMPTALGYALRYRLIGACGYTFVSLAGYLVPGFGVLWGALLLNETVTAQALTALALILAGVGVGRIEPGFLRRWFDARATGTK